MQTTHKNSSTQHHATADSTHEMCGIEDRLSSTPPHPTPNVFAAENSLKTLPKLMVLQKMFQCTIDNGLLKTQKAKAYCSHLQKKTVK